MPKIRNTLPWAKQKFTIKQSFQKIEKPVPDYLGTGFFMK